MANAAAKKAAAAKEATANVYQPLLMGSNLLYCLLLWWMMDPGWNVWTILSVMATWGLQLFAYLGIIDRAKNNNKANSTNSTSTAASTANSKQKDLVGGAHLDLLGLTLTVQYASVLHSTKWFYLLWLVPMWGGWMLYTTFLGGGKNKGATATATGSTAVEVDEDEDPANKDKREKRAQKRKQKWG
jgi:hypothetical protein